MFAKRIKNLENRIGCGVFVAIGSGYDDEGRQLYDTSEGLMTDDGLDEIRERGTKVTRIGEGNWGNI